MKTSNPIVYIADEEYLHLLPANFDQLSRHAGVEQSVYVVTTAASIPVELCNLGEAYPNLEIVIRQVNFEYYVSIFDKPKKTHVTRIALLKFFLPEILSEDIILYLDIDTFICSSLNSLLTYIPNNPIAAVEEVGINAYLRNTSESYFNSGVIVMSLKKMRLLDISGQLNRMISESGVSNSTVDQDFFNQIFKGLVDFLPQRFNVFICNCDSYSLGAFVRYPSIVHFVGSDKPWKYPQKSKYSRLWAESFAHGIKSNPSPRQLAILRSRQGVLNVSRSLNLMGKLRVTITARIKSRVPRVVKDFFRSFV